jgi:hypothetical protein
MLMITCPSALWFTVRTGFHSFQNEKSYFFIKIRKMDYANKYDKAVLRLRYYTTG